jgi:hypothetical protein
MRDKLRNFRIELPANLGPGSSLDDARLAVNAFNKLYQLWYTEYQKQSRVQGEINMLEKKRQDLEAEIDMHIG